VEQGHYENPMAEIALALAMGFFAIMVLAIVSMTAGHAQAALDKEESLRFVAAVLQPAAGESRSAATRTAPELDELIIFYQGRFLDSELRPVDPAALSSGLAGARPGAPIVLAIPPDISLAAAMDARAGIDREDVVVATLDQRWLQALERSAP
jgi:hypothetical protein